MPPLFPSLNVRWILYERSLETKATNSKSKLPAFSYGRVCPLIKAPFPCVCYVVLIHVRSQQRVCSH